MFVYETIPIVDIIPIMAMVINISIIVKPAESFFMVTIITNLSVITKFCAPINNYVNQVLASARCEVCAEKNYSPDAI